MNVKEIKPKGFFGIFKSSTYEVTAAMDEKQQARPTGIIDIRADEKIPLPPLKPVNQASFEAAFDKKKELTEEKSKQPKTNETPLDESKNTKELNEKVQKAMVELVVQQMFQNGLNNQLNLLTLLRKSELYRMIQ